MTRREEMYIAAALTGLTANPHHYMTQIPQFVKGAMALGKAVAAAVEGEVEADELAKLEAETRPAASATAKKH